MTDYNFTKGGMMGLFRGMRLADVQRVCRMHSNFDFSGCSKGSVAETMVEYLRSRGSHYRSVLVPPLLNELCQAWEWWDAGSGRRRFNDALQGALASQTEEEG